MRTAVVFIGGDPPHPAVLARLPDDRWVVAADRGLDHARALGVTVHLLVGDLDSVSPEALADAEREGVAVERHPAEKDATDIELALDAAIRRDHQRIMVVSGIGDRLDHSLGALLALAHPRLRSCLVEAYWGEAHVGVLHGGASLVLGGTVGDVVSLLPVNGPASGITTSGLRYPLTGGTLDAASSRGVSNEFVGRRASVQLTTGTLFVITPYALRKGTL